MYVKFIKEDSMFWRPYERYSITLFAQSNSFFSVSTLFSDREGVLLRMFDLRRLENTGLCRLCIMTLV
jgi:hypothetical protein